MTPSGSVFHEVTPARTVPAAGWTHTEVAPASGTAATPSAGTATVRVATRPLVSTTVTTAEPGPPVAARSSEAETPLVPWLRSTLPAS